MAAHSVEEILDPGYVEQLAERPLEEIRARRDAANEIETGLSYLRRLLQGRLDIVLAERQRRASGLPAGDLAVLVERLPEILGDHVSAPGLGRLQTITAPGEVDPSLQARIEALVPPSTVAHLAEVPDEDVTSMAEGLEELEREVSARRRALHGVLDALQEEIVRRYRTGEATVDNLLG